LLINEKKRKIFGGRRKRALGHEDAQRELKKTAKGKKNSCLFVDEIRRIIPEKVVILGG